MNAIRRAVDGFRGRLHRPARPWVMGLLCGLLFAVIAVAALAFTQPGQMGRALIAFGEPADLHSGAYSCVECHKQPNPDARLWAAVNGTPIAAGEVITMAPGDTFEVDYHFTNMVSDTTRFYGVGTELLLPKNAEWRVGIGTPGHPQAWLSDGKGGNFWGSSWDRSGNGDGPIYVKWLAVKDRPQAYALSFAGMPWHRMSEAVVGSDRGKGDPGDRDGVANHMGADALIQLSVSTPPGAYDLTLAGVGHDKQNQRANVSLTFTVQVERGESRSNAGPLVGGPDSEAGRPMTSRPDPGLGTGATLYKNACGSCHGAAPSYQLMQALDKQGAPAVAKIIAEGKGRMAGLGVQKAGKLTEAQVADIVSYIRTQQQVRTGGPPIDHTVRGRVDCLGCHDAQGVRPKPSSHQQYRQNGACNTCHRAAAGGAPEPRHTLEGREACLSCHSPEKGIMPMPDDHGNRGDATCRNCHEPLGVRLGPGASGGIPTVPHSVARRKNCLLCHDIEDGFLPVPKTHVGRKEISCLGCHKVNEIKVPPRPTPFGGAPAQAGTTGGTSGAALGRPAGGPATEMPHTAVDHELCLSCHLPGGTFTAIPANHSMDESTCVSCHREKEKVAPANQAAPAIVPSANDVQEER